LPDWKRHAVTSRKPGDEGQRALVQWATWVFFVFLILIFVGQYPFSPRTQEQLVELASRNDGSNITKQLFFTLSAILLGGLMIFKADKRSIPLVVVPIAVMLLWFFVTCFWSVDPFVSLKRVLQQVIALFIMFAAATIIGYDGIYKSLRLALIVSLLVCFVSLGLTPNAFHPPTESDPALIGAWRGFFFHKNIAGAVFAMGFVLFALEYLEKRRWYDLVLTIMAAVFVFGSKSKTSLALAFFILATSIGYHFMTKSVRSRTVLLILLGASAIGGLWAYILFEEPINRIFADPGSFTGRVSIWELVIRYCSTHILTGAGFGGFWQVGAKSPALTYATEPFHALIAHSHNGYLEMLVTTGLPGFVLLLISFVVMPAKRILFDDRVDRWAISKAFALWQFVCFHNLMETSFFDKDRQIWVMFLCSITIIFMQREAVAPRFRRAEAATATVDPPRTLRPRRPSWTRMGSEA
jgi:exopolysaccharide production protein ExoQ